MRIQMLFEISVCIRLGRSEQPIIKPNFGIHRVGGANPMNCAFDFASSGRPARFALQVRGAMQFSDIATGVLYDLLAFDDVSVLKPNLATWSEPEILWRSSFHEIIAIDV